MFSYGFEFTEKLRPFEQYLDPSGDNKTFMLVTCGRPEISTRVRIREIESLPQTILILNLPGSRNRNADIK